jgi:hypothetical protein
MRKLKLIEHISLDGVIQHSADDGDFPYSDWTAPYRTPAGRDAMLAAYGGSYVAYVVIGVVFFQAGTAALNGPFEAISTAFWDNPEDDEDWNDA